MLLMLLYLGAAYATSQSSTSMDRHEELQRSTRSIETQTTITSEEISHFVSEDVLLTNTETMESGDVPSNPPPSPSGQTDNGGFFPLSVHAV